MEKALVDMRTRYNIEEITIKGWEPAQIEAAIEECKEKGRQFSLFLLSYLRGKFKFASQKASQKRSDRVKKSSESKMPRNVFKAFSKKCIGINACFTFSGIFLIPSQKGIKILRTCYCFSFPARLRLH